MKNYWDYFWPKVTMCSWLMGHIHKGGGGGGGESITETLKPENC